MDKRAESESMSWLVNLIIIIVVILVVGAGMFVFLRYEGWKIFPDFNDEEIDDIDNIVVEEGVVVELENPLEVRYLIKGKDAENIYYNCNEVDGWRWYYEKVGKWWKVSSTESVYFKELNVKNQRFIESLQELSCENGLGVLVDRVMENDEGRNLGFKSQVGLKIFVNDKSVFYASGDKIFEDTRFLIKKINMMGEG